MRDHRILFAVIALSVMAFFVVASTPVKADRANVKMFIWNTATSSITYPWKAWTATIGSQTTVQVWIDAPDAWTNTPMGIVSWKVKLEVNPAQVLVINAIQYGDDPLFPDFADGIPDDILGLFLSEYIGSGSLLWAPPIVDAVAGTIEAGEAIAGFTTLGVGSGGAITKIDGSPFATTPSGDRLIPLVKFTMKSQPGLTSGGSLLSLIEGTYVTPDSVQHPVEVVEGGVYGVPPSPEFPFGIGILMMIAPAGAVMYLWRRKKVTK